MKKIFLLAILSFHVAFAFGQERGYKKTNWSNYRSFSCFPNLQISFRSLGYEPVVKKYEYQFRIKNNSTKNVHFNLGVIIKKSNEKLMAGRFSISSGKERTHVSSYASAEPEPNGESFFSSTITGYLENDKDDWTLPSYSCNNGVKVCDQNCNTKAPNKVNSSNSQNSNNVIGGNFGQPQLETTFMRRNEFLNKDGILVIFESNKKADTRYDEYCKVYFDKHIIKATIINTNNDKAVDFTSALFYFMGDICNKIYNDSGPVGGEIINQGFVFNISKLTKNKTQYLGNGWNRWVSLLPNDKLTAEAYIEVKQGKPCPEPHAYDFTYNLLTLNNPNTSVQNNVSNIIGNENTNKSNKLIDYNTLIIGKWKMVACATSTGLNLPYEVSEEYFSDFKPNGKLVNLNRQFYGKVHTNMSWKITGKTLNFNEPNYSFDGRLLDSYGVDYEILMLDETTLVLKYQSIGLSVPDGILIYKYKKIEQK